MPLDAPTLARLARTQEVLLTARTPGDDTAWRSELARELRALFRADLALVMRPDAAEPYVADGLDASTCRALAAFHPASSDVTAVRHVRYRDPALEQLQAKRLANPDPVFTRAGNEAAMGISVEATPMFDAVLRPLGVRDFSGVFARTVHGDTMCFVARTGATTSSLIGTVDVGLWRVLAPAVAVATAMGARPSAAVAPRDAAWLRTQFGLTPREADVALAISEGLSRAEIAERLGVRPATVRTHTEAVFRKLDVRTRSSVGRRLLHG
jgi:DNA-binding CsgD family transcriptional regulator